METKDCETVKCPICHEKIDKNVAKNINCVQCSTILHDQCFRRNTLAYRQVEKELTCPQCRLSWESKVNSSIIPGCEQDGKAVEDIDIIADEPDPVFEENIAFGLDSLNKFHCITCKNRCGEGEHRQMIDLILLCEKDLDYLLDETNFIPITIIETFLALLNHSFHNDNGIIIHPTVQGEVDYNQVTTVELNIKKKPSIYSVIQEHFPAKNEYHTYSMKIDVYKLNGNVLCSANMYDGVVTDADENDFEVPKERLKSVLTCYNTKVSGHIRHKREVNYLTSNKLLHALDKEKLPQSSYEIDRNSCGAIACLMILKESTPEKSNLIMQLKPENYRKEFCHQLKVLLSRYRNEFFLTNDFDKNKYFQTLRYIHFSCEVNVNDKCNSCKNDIIDEYAFERNPLADKDTCFCQTILPFCVTCLRKNTAYMKCCKCNSNIMELDIVTFNPYSIKSKFQFKTRKDLNNTDQSTIPYTFEGIFNGMFVMEDFHHKMTSLTGQSYGKVSIGYSEKVHNQKVGFMKQIYSDFKDLGKFKYLQGHNFSLNGNIISFTQSINLNCTLTESNEWKNKCIASELTIYFLIENKKDNVFPDWHCWQDLKDDISFDGFEQEFDSLKNKKFDLTRKHFKEIVKSIPYMFIEKYLVCPCSLKFKDHFFHLLEIVPPISPFKCNCDAVFDNIDDLLRHLKPSELVPDSLTNMDCFQKAFYCWLMFYNELPTKQIVNPYATPLLSSSSIKKICTPLNLNKEFIQRSTQSFPKPFVKNPYKKRIYSGVIKCSNSINNSVNQLSKKHHKPNKDGDMLCKQRTEGCVNQLSNKHHKPNKDGDMLCKQRTEGINNFFVLNKKIKLPFENKNEEIKNYELTTKELYQMNKNLAPEKLCNKNIIMCTKHVSDEFDMKIPLSKSFSSTLLKINNTINPNNTFKSCNSIPPFPSRKCNFKVNICPMNNKLTLEKSNKSKAIVTTVTATLDIALSSEAIVDTVTEWNVLYPSLLKHYPVRKDVHISRHTITQLIKHFYQEKKNNVILNSKLIEKIYSFLFPETNYVSDAKEFFDRIKSNDKYNKPLYNVLSNKGMVDFNHSNILDREDEMLMRYQSAEQTIKWINENETIPDMYDWYDFRERYNHDHANCMAQFNYTKEDFCKVASFLPLMLIDVLFVCPCDQAFSNVFWNEFSLCQPIKEGCKGTQRCPTGQFKQLIGLKRHCLKYKDPHHEIVYKYICYYEQNRKKSNFLVGQLLDATCFSTKHLLKTTDHLYMFNKRIESMFTITDVRQDGHCGFASVVLCLKNLNACNENMDQMNLRREMSKILVQSTESVSLFKASFPSLWDIDSQRMSQTSSVDFTIYSLKERIFDTAYFNNEYFSKKNSYTSKKYWFDSQYYFVLLAIMFKDLWFYCYSEVTKDLFVYKYDKGQRKVIVKNTHIYHLVHYNHCVCLLHCDNIHYKALIRKEKKMLVR